MTSIDFYTGADDPLDVAARLAAKAWQQYGHVRVLTPNAETTDAKIGRSMKKREITACAPQPASRGPHRRSASRA